MNKFKCRACSKDEIELKEIEYCYLSFKTPDIPKYCPIDDSNMIKPNWIRIERKQKVCQKEK
jgi:hypothetical protein